MDFNATIDLIIKDLDDARKIIDDLKSYPGVPALQVELAKSKCKSAGEIIAMLKEIKDPATVAEKTDPIVFEPEIKKVPVTKTEDVTAKKREESPAPEARSLSRPGKKDTQDSTIRKSAESSILADNFSHLSARFNEQLGSMKGEEDISDMIKSKPLSSLSEAIGLNDSFRFIREIFNGDKEAYAQAITRLESAKNLPDARATIMSYRGNDKENEAVEQLMELVKRKLHSNE